MDELTQLMKDRTRIHNELVEAQNRRTVLIEQLHTIFDDAALFLQSPYKFNREGYYFTLDLKLMDAGMGKRIIVEKKWKRIDLLAITEEEFSTIIHMIQDELISKYKSEIKENTTIIKAMK